MASKDAAGMSPRSSSSEFEDDYSDNHNLLGFDKTRKQHKKQQQRSWAFLAVNVFVLLLNIGLLLMISSPRGLTIVEETLPVRLPYAGQFISSDCFWHSLSHEDPRKLLTLILT
jgi:hypothetical protein